MFLNNRGEGLASIGSTIKPDPLAMLLTGEDLDEAFVKTASYEIRYSAGAFEIGGERVSRQQAIMKLAEEGFDQESISEIIKTAEQQSGMPTEFAEVSKTLKAILAELVENKYSLVDLKYAVYLPTTTGGPG